MGFKAGGERRERKFPTLFTSFFSLSPSTASHTDLFRDSELVASFGLKRKWVTFTFISNPSRGRLGGIKQSHVHFNCLANQACAKVHFIFRQTESRHSDGCHQRNQLKTSSLILAIRTQGHILGYERQLRIVGSKEGTRYAKCRHTKCRVVSVAAGGMEGCAI